MCRESRNKICPYNLTMEGENHKQRNRVFFETSILLELAASDDLAGFKSAVEGDGLGVDEPSLWYGRRIGSKKMGLEERTPLLIASIYGSTEVLKYIIGTGKVDVNRACGSDGATALHCAASGGSDSSVEVVKLLLDASADIESADASGNKSGDLIARSFNPKRKILEMLLRGASAHSIEQSTSQEVAQEVNLMTQLPKKEYPVDISLPDINNGVYSTDEFRMYSFKVKPCSRAYSHDWTECPFVHPGENARRRDPRKYHYTCVPCPEFRKGTCAKGDACEYAHGVFESWLHPAQYKTRLCKDEIGCSRKVCFFAHRAEELRPLYASTGSALPSPKSFSSAAVDMATLSSVALGSSPLMSPVVCSSPMSGNLWQNKVNLNLTPPTLQLPGSRLKTGSSARDLELEMELLGLENFRNQQRQQLIDELSGLSSPYSMSGELKPTNLDDIFGSLDPSLLYQLQGLSPKNATTATTTNQLQSPSSLQIRQNMNQLRASYPTNLSSSPMRKNGFESSGAAMNSRLAGFTKRSQSFIDRGAVNHHRPGGLGLTAAANSASLMSSNLSDWSSPDGKLDWGYQGEELNKLKKSASFGYRSGNVTTNKPAMASSAVDEPDVSWVNSLVKDFSSVGAGLYSSEQKRGGLNETMTIPPWVEQLYIEQEQMVA